MRAVYWMLAGVGLLTAVAVLVLATPGADAWYTGTQCPASGDWTVSTATKYYDEIINVNGNLYVNNPLTLTNCIVRMNTASIDGGATINVPSGSTLTVHDSRLDSNNGAYHYKFTVYGSLHINRSVVTEMWGDTASWVGGIQLYSSNVWIGNSTIFNGKTGGIYIGKCGPWIYNNNIYGNGGSGTSTYSYGIYALGDGATRMNITTNAIYRNTYASGSYQYGYGIRAEYLNNADLISYNNIYDNGFLTTSSYNRGYQLYLHYATPTLTGNRFTNGNYQVYCYYSNPPTINGGTVSGYARSSTTVYGVYATYSGLTFANVTFTTSNMGFTQYGIYSSSYSPVNVTDCTFDYRLYGSYTSYAIQASSYSPVTVTRCNFYQYSYSTIYPIYASSYCDISVTNSTIYNSQGYFYGIYASSYCKVNLTNTNMYSSNAYYSYMVRASSNSPVRIQGGRLDIQYNYYDARLVEASSSSPVYINKTVLNMFYCNMYQSAYQMFGIRTYSSSPVQISNVTASFDGNQCYYWYMFYVESASLEINDTRITDVNGWYYYYYYMFYMGWSSGNLLMRNVTVDFDAGIDYQWGGVYITQGYNYGSNPKLRLDRVTLRGTANGYFYGFYWGYGSVFVNNSVIDVSASGEGFYFTQTWYGDFEFHNTQITAQAERAQYGSILQGYTWGDVRKFIVDNCTIDFYTSNTPSSSGGVGIFQQLQNMNARISNTTVNAVNTDGAVSYQMFYVYYPLTLEVVDCELNAVFGQGTGTSAPPIQWGWFYQTPLMNFTRCNITIDIIDEPVALDTFYFESSCGDLNLNKTNVRWSVDAPGSTVGMVTMSDYSWSPGQLSTLSLVDSKLDMVVSKPDCSLSLLRITEQTKIGAFMVASSEVNMEFLVASSTPTSAIQISGSDVAISDLRMNLKAPAGTQTELIGISVEGGSPTFKGISIQGNGNGRISGILCSLASTPLVDGCRINNTYMGIAGDFFGMPRITRSSIENCSIGMSLQNFCNATTVDATIKGKLAVQLRESSRVNMYTTTIAGTTSDWELNGSSTAWLLDCNFKPATAASFLDGTSRLVVNWYLSLRVEWQNGAPIARAGVVLKNAPGDEFLRTVTDDEGLVRTFVIVEYVQVKAAKTMLSPYTVKVSFGGVSGEQSVVTNISKEELIVIRDDLDPVVTITEPPAGTVQGFVTVTLLGTASDVGSGPDFLQMSWDGTSWDTIPARAVWVHQMDVPEGSRTITVRVVDRAGNTGTAALPIVIDLTAPFIDVESPDDQSLGNSIGVDLVGSVEKGSALTINFRPVSVTPEGDFTYGVRLVEGRNEFVLFARDLAGNTNTVTWTLFLDITPPALTVSSPADGLLTNRAAVTVAGRTEAGAALTVNDLPVEVGPDGTFSAGVDLTAGPNFVTVVASDAAGNRASVLRTVVMDDQLLLKITSPDPEKRLVTREVTILVEGATDIDALVRLNNGIVSVEPDGTFSVTHTLNEGANTLEFRASDRAGNSRELTLMIQLDTTLPFFEVGSPRSGATFRDGNVPVTGICEPGINLTISIAGQPDITLDTSTGVFNATASIPEGGSLLVFRATDAAGNEVALEISVVVDVTAPSLDIVEPSDGFRTTDRSVIVVGVTEPGAKVKVNGVSAMVDAFGKFTVELSLVKGANKVSATSTDAAGNEATEDITIKLVEPAASVESGTWWWTALGLLLALGLMVPLTMYMVNAWQKNRMEKGGSK